MLSRKQVHHEFFLINRCEIYIVYTVSYIIVLSISVVLWQSQLNNYSKYDHAANFRQHNVMEARRKVEPRYSNKTNSVELSLKDNKLRLFGLIDG